MDILWTLLIGFGLLGCGAYLGRKSATKTYAAMILANFSHNLIKDEIVDKDKFIRYMETKYKIKDYGGGLYDDPKEG